MIILLAATALVFAIGISRVAVADGPSVNMFQQHIQLAHHETGRASGRTFVFDPRDLQWRAYDDGRLVKSGRASGGAHTTARM